MTTVESAICPCLNVRTCMCGRRADNGSGRSDIADETLDSFVRRPLCSCGRHTARMSVQTITPTPCNFRTTVRHERPSGRRYVFGNVSGKTRTTTREIARKLAEIGGLGARVRASDVEWVGGGAPRRRPSIGPYGYYPARVCAASVRGRVQRRRSSVGQSRHTRGVPVVQ